jgi:hypothetical protein
MSSQAIDPILNKWAEAHSLNIQKFYKESEVRSVDFIDAIGNRSFQIWIDEPTRDGFVYVHVWDFKKRREDWTVSIASLQETLETAVKWIKS